MKTIRLSFMLHYEIRPTDVVCF